MADTEESKFKFFVYIVESPSSVDLYHKRSESDLLRQAINLNLIPCIDRVAISREAFEAAIRVGLYEEMKKFPGLIPVIHISAHGFCDGIQLSNGEIIEWAQLRELVKPVNEALKGSLLICMSSCEGYSGSRMAMTTSEDEYPFFALVGNVGKPTWSETAIGFATFYHLISKGNFIIDSVEAMQVASGNADFYVTTAEQSRQAYLEFIENLDSQEAQTELEQDVQNEEPSRLAKLLELSNEQQP
ncbi:MAG: hypothetical protein AB2745_19830 [Candidatus Thiodiazotropha endolucinida]